MDTFEPSREDQLTEKKLNWGYWWVTNKLKVRKVFIVVLTVVDFALIGNFVFAYADWFFGSGVVERQQIAQLTVPATDYAFFRSKNAPVELSVNSTNVVSSGDGKFDIVSQVNNPNQLWWADFDYSFALQGGRTDTQRGYILPNSTHSLAALGVPADTSLVGASLLIENLTWHRVNQRFTRPDYVSWAGSRLAGIAVSDPVFVPPLPDDAIPAYRVRFRVTNGTAFGYYKVGFFLTLVSGGQVVGVSKVTISELRAGTSRDVEATWFSDLPSVSGIEVMPEVNIFDERNYIAPGQ
jgi:hypothetical protein